MADTANSTALIKKTNDEKIEITDLSFINVSDGKHCPVFWDVKATGDRNKDRIFGARYAIEYLEFEANQLAGYPILPSIIRDMPRKLTAIEVTFLGLIGYAATSGRYEAKRIAGYWKEMDANAAII